MSEIKRGDRVRCIDDNFNKEIQVHYDNLPRKGYTYLVEHVSQGRNVLSLVGLTNPHGCYFFCRRFEVVKPIPRKMAAKSKSEHDIKFGSDELPL